LRIWITWSVIDALVKVIEKAASVAFFLINLKRNSKMIKWITGRLSEPSSYAAIGVGVIAIGTISGIGELVFVGLGCAILGLILSEEAKK